MLIRTNVAVRENELCRARRGRVRHRDGLPPLGLHRLRGDLQVAVDSLGYTECCVGGRHLLLLLVLLLLVLLVAAGVALDDGARDDGVQLLEALRRRVAGHALRIREGVVVAGSREPEEQRQVPVREVHMVPEEARPRTR